MGVPARGERISLGAKGDGFSRHVAREPAEAGTFAGLFLVTLSPTF